MTGPENTRRWTAADIRAFSDRLVAEIETAGRTSPQAACRHFAQQSSAALSEMTAAALDSVQLEERLQAQGTPEADLERLRHARSRIIAAAGKVFTLAMEAATAGENPGAGDAQNDGQSDG